MWVVWILLGVLLGLVPRLTEWFLRNYYAAPKPTLLRWGNWMLHPQWAEYSKREITKLEWQGNTYEHKFWVCFRCLPKPEQATI